MEMRLSVITASRSTCTPTIHLVNDNPHAIDVPHYRQHARQRFAALSTARGLTMRRIIDNLRANESGSSIPFGRQPNPLTRKRAQQQPRHTVTRKGRRSKRNPSPASERNIKSATLPLTCALARWGFRFAGLLSRVNAWPFRFVMLLRVTASVVWQNGMEMRLSVITASRSTCTPTIHLVNDNPHAIDVPHYRQHARQRFAALSTARGLTMRRIIDNLRANESGSSIPFGLTLSRKRPAPPDRTAIPEKSRRFGPKRNPSPARERSIESVALPLTYALAR